MRSFRTFLDNKLITEADGPGAPPGGPPGGGPPGGGPGGAPPLPMPGGGGGPPGGMGGGLGGMGGPAPGGGGAQTPAKKLKAYNVWDAIEKVVDPQASGDKKKDNEDKPENPEAKQPEQAPTP